MNLGAPSSKLAILAMSLGILVGSHSRAISDPLGELTIMLPGNVPLEMVLIPAGGFTMGSPDSERGRDPNEGPQTVVGLSSFYMGKYEITQAQWLAVMGSWRSAPSAMFGLGPNYPAYRISWLDAQDFATALSAHLVASGQGTAEARLPTEAEWEYACRAGTQSRFYYGDSLGVVDFCLDDGARGLNMWYCGNNSPNNGSTIFGGKPVGQKLPNEFGLHDMHGNVMEWCQDLYATSLPGGSVTDPTGPTDGFTRVVRGGTWSSDTDDCRSAFRGDVSPTFRGSNYGFRIVYLGTTTSVLLGDIDGNGMVNVADVTRLGNLLRANDPPPDSVADVNGDGEVNWLDVQALAALVIAR